MSLRSKFMWVMAALIVSYLVLGGALLRGVFDPAFAALEARAVDGDVERVEQALGVLIEQLDTMNSNWSWWNEAYQYVQKPNDVFLRKYFYENFHRENDIDLVLFYDAAGRRLWGRCSDVDRDEVLPLEELTGDALALDPAFLHHDSVWDSQTGVMMTRYGPLLLSSRPVVDSVGNGPIAGTLVMGRFLDADKLALIHKQTQARFELIPFDDASLAPALRSALAAGDASSAAPVREQTDAFTFAYTLERDVRGAPAFVLRTQTDRAISAVGKKAVAAALLALAVVGALLTTAIWVLLQRVILAPISQLTAHVVKLRSERDLRARLGLSRRDELGTLADQFDGLTGELDAALRVKSEFLATMSHEIRTPLNGVIGLIEMLLHTPLSVQQRHFAAGIERSADTLLSLLNDILDFSKLESGKLELENTEFELRGLIEEVALLFAGPAHAKGLELVCDLAPDLDARCQGDPGRLRQVLVNLLGNAVKFTDTGEVRIRATLEDAGVVRFAVRDSGVGIRPEQQSRIFDSFTQADASTTRRFGGSGLGLSISAKLVDAMGGRIEIDSAAGHGARFHFALPLHAATPVEAPAAGASALRDTRVLVADSNAASREGLLCQLRAWKVPAAGAGTVAQALAMLREAAARAAAFDVVLLEHRPAVMDGLALARTIRAEAPLAQTQLVTLSTAAELADDEDVASLGLRARLVKPVLRAHLYACLTTLQGDDDGGGLALLAPSAARDVLDGARDERAAPAPRAPSAAERPDPAPQRDAPLRGHVLVAEDNPLNQQLAQAVLQMLGCSVAIAANGQAALEELERTRFDLVLMDCRMPVMDGYQASREIRRREAARGGARLPIVALTASTGDGEREKCEAAGMDDYLAKPFRQAALRALLARWLAAEPRRS
jgi:signal transduction histidine kinase/DNA-binding response OmpR family regulator